MCIQTQVQGKPHKPEEAEEQRSTENLHESNEAIQNETFRVVRGKREVIYNFTSFCKIMVSLIDRQHRQMAVNRHATTVEDTLNRFAKYGTLGARLIK